MINNRRTICILGGTGTVGVTACKVLSKLGYSLRVSVRNIETIKDTGMYMAPNIQWVYWEKEAIDPDFFQRI